MMYPLLCFTADSCCSAVQKKRCKKCGLRKDGKVAPRECSRRPAASGVGLRRVPVVPRLPAASQFACLRAPAPPLRAPAAPLSARATPQPAPAAPLSVRATLQPHCAAPLSAPAAPLTDPTKSYDEDAAAVALMIPDLFNACALDVSIPQDPVSVSAWADRILLASDGDVFKGCFDDSDPVPAQRPSTKPSAASAVAPRTTLNTAISADGSALKPASRGSAVPARFSGATRSVLKPRALRVPRTTPKPACPAGESAPKSGSQGSAVPAAGSATKQALPGTGVASASSAGSVPPDTAIAASQAASNPPESVGSVEEEPLRRQLPCGASAVSSRRELQSSPDSIASGDVSNSRSPREISTSTLPDVPKPPARRGPSLDSTAPVPSQPPALTESKSPPEQDARESVTRQPSSTAVASTVEAPRRKPGPKSRVQSLSPAMPDQTAGPSKRGRRRSPKSPPGSRTTLANRLQMTMALVDEERDLRCSKCDIRFGSPRDLAGHLRQHNAKRPFQCDECGKSFAEYWTLRMHQFIHTGEKPFQCAVCSKKFRAKDSLRQHMALHSGEKRYPCKSCGEKFKFRSSQHRHRKFCRGPAPQT
ncbi:B-cell CLL/lymphoma 6 member B protein-like isoform X2 [Thrips palmi]|uniref:B-cell CLL/lymphoma 6 member B protein-like isoform X2 n=1 Tax=Thrips palmi TaxID=161013 RepID=A0A6P8ZHF4_THRPL|nr:B-cell CLL/lymphoma 6 member B protein-like isoform X2 [Thrips palmi]